MITYSDIWMNDIHRKKANRWEESSRISSRHITHLALQKRCQVFLN